MEGDQKFLLDLKKVIHRKLKFRGEDHATIADDEIGKNKVLNYYIEDDLWKARRVDSDIH